MKSSPEQEEQAVLKEICQVNGINYDSLAMEGRHLKVLEMFFTGMPRMVRFGQFPFLEEVTLFSQTISKIGSLDGCPNIRKLWICECELTEINTFRGSEQLKALFLYENKIKKIENLDSMVHLERLWLNENKISQIEGLDNLKHLKELNLSGNLIERIGNGLDGVPSLETVFLSGNNLYSLSDLINLSRLTKLKTVGLKDPQYARNPVCLLSNYSTFLLFHLPNIFRFDSFDVSTKQVKDVAENVVMKKKMFYFMKIRGIKRTTAALVNKLKHTKDEILRTPNERIRALEKCRKELKREENDISNPEMNEVQEEERQNRIQRIQLKFEKLEEHKKVWDMGCHCLDKQYRDAIQYVQNICETEIRCQMIELESGGNIKFEKGTANQAWFKLCGELLASRFCVQELHSYSVTGIKVNNVYRVHNSLLQTVYDDVVADALEKMSADTGMDVERLSKKHQEYLLWCNDPDAPGAVNELLRIIEEGFRSPAYYAEIGENEGIPLTNSLNIADFKRITKKQNGPMVDDNCPFRIGRVLIVKVFTGNSVKPLDAGEIRQHDYPDAFGGFRMSNSKKHMNSSSCECATRQIEYFMFNSKVILPEYIIDFEYLTQKPSVSPFHQVIYDTPMSPKSVPKSILFDLTNTDSDALHYPPVLAVRQQISDINENTILTVSNSLELCQITHLDLMGNNLTKLAPLDSLTNLKTLIVCFNELTKLDDVTASNLEVLDASFNRLHTLDGLKNMTCLKKLDVSWNQIHNSRENVSFLHKHTPNITHLSVAHNPWQKVDSLRLRIIGRLKCLIKLDNNPVMEEESAAALRMAAGSRISQVVLLTHSRTNTITPRTLSLHPVAQALHSLSRCRIDRSVEESNWQAKITSLCLDSQHISKISNLERLENLRYASFNGNDITKLEGFDLCKLLEELSMEDNCITKIENISHLSRLRRLFLANNYISSFMSSGLEHLPNLETIAFENNRIASLRGIENCLTLLEIYLANNRIADSRDVFFLKNLSNLIILDLFGNSLTHLSKHYRLSIIYHLKTLKALDGQPVELDEVNMSRELLGGKLTCDFLIEKQGHDRFYEIRELDFPSTGIRSVELNPSERFINLRSINLEHNNLTSFSGLIHLTNLRVLCLNHNHVESIIPRPTGKNANKPLDLTVEAKLSSPLLENLDVLHLGYNGIKDLTLLQLHRLPSLKALFLQGNEIVTIEGLEGLQDLRELVLDRNKIKCVSETSFINNWNLHELHMEENRFRELKNLAPLENLHRLFLGSNRIQDFNELERLEYLQQLVEVSIINNSVARRSLHRPMLVFRLPRLQIIDGIAITDEEREKSDYYFNDQAVQSAASAIPTVGDIVLPGIPNTYKNSVPVKVTNVNLGSAVDPGVVAWYEQAASSSTISGQAQQTVGSNNAASAATLAVSTNAGRLRGGVRLTPAPLQPPTQSRPVYYYDPSGHVEPASRWGYNKRK